MMKKLPIMALAAAAVIGCGKETPADKTGDGIIPPPPPLPDDVCSGIVDESFKKYCLANFDKDKDGKISPQEAERVKTIGSDGLLDVVTFTGIEYFTNLETFTCTNNENVEAIDLHYNTKITEIQAEAFIGCSNMKTFIFPPNVKTIVQSPFGYCLSLTEITIPYSVEKIVGEGMFAYCSSLTAIRGKFASADERCMILDDILLAFAPAGVTEFSIPEGVKSIGEYAFACSHRLAGITVPGSVESIGERAFEDSGLTAVTIPGSVTAIGPGAFYGCEKLVSVNVPDNVTTLSETFIKCSSLRNIVLGSGLKTISSAFNGCSSLESVTIKAVTPPALNYVVFNIDEQDKFVINVPESAVDAYKTAEGWKDYAEYIRGM